MSLLDYMEHGRETLIETAIRRIQEYEPKDLPYWLAFSGGKDSVVLKWLADKAGVKYEAVYNFCAGIEPPELSRFIKNQHPDVRWIIPEKDFVTLMVEHRFPPTRRIRWCCADLKEGGNDKEKKGRTLLTGIRWSESSRRSKRKMVEICYNDTSRKYVNPIIDWEDSQIWAVIKENKIPYCNLYDEGWTRLGCVLCPMADRKTREREMERWPHIKKLWERGFKKLFEMGPRKEWTDWGRWETWGDMWDWWLEKQIGKNNDESQECFRFTDN